MDRKEQEQKLKDRYVIAMCVLHLSLLLFLISLAVFYLSSEVFLGPSWLVLTTKIAVGVIGLIGVGARIAEGEIEKKLDEIREQD